MVARRAHGRRARRARRRHRRRGRPRATRRPRSARRAARSSAMAGFIDVLVNNVGEGTPAPGRIPRDPATTTSRRRSSQLLRRPAGHPRRSRRMMTQGGGHRQRRLRQRLLPPGRAGDRLWRGEGGAAERREGPVAGAGPEGHPNQQRLARAGRDRPLAGRSRCRRDDRPCHRHRPRRVAQQADRPRCQRSFQHGRGVATLVALLASPRTANVTGANYVIDGGLVKTM